MSPERLARINHAAELLGRHQLTRAQCKRALRTRYKCCRRSAEEYIAVATRMMRAGCRTSKVDALAVAVAFYEGVIADPEASHRDKILAQTRIDKLLGHEAPDPGA